MKWELVEKHCLQKKNRGCGTDLSTQRWKLNKLKEKLPTITINDTLYVWENEFVDRSIIGFISWCKLKTAVPSEWFRGNTLVKTGIMKCTKRKGYETDTEMIIKTI